MIHTTWGIIKGVPKITSNQSDDTTYVEQCEPNSHLMG